MTAREPSFTLGIEEEYLLVDRESRDVVIDPPREIFDQCAKQAEHGEVERELLRSQIEVETSVCETVAEARQELARLRKLASDVSRQSRMMNYGWNCSINSASFCRCCYL